MGAEAQLDEQGVVHISGALDRSAATRLWPQIATMIKRANTLDVGRITRLDSAGLALISCVAQTGLPIRNHASGSADLATAYRLNDQLALPDMLPDRT